jgi:hypothetical protein
MGSTWRIWTSIKRIRLVKGLRRHSGEDKLRERDKNPRGGVIIVGKNLRGAIIAGKKLREGMITVDEDERADQVLRILEKHREMMVLELPHGRAEPGITPDRQVQSALRESFLAITPVDHLSL